MDIFKDRTPLRFDGLFIELGLDVFDAFDEVLTSERRL